MKHAKKTFFFFFFSLSQECEKCLADFLSCSDLLCISEHFARLSLAKPLQNEGPHVSGSFFCFVLAICISSSTSVSSVYEPAQTT